MDGRTDGRTDIFPPVILLGRFLEVDLIILLVDWKMSKSTKNIEILHFLRGSVIMATPCGVRSVISRHFTGESVSVFKQSCCSFVPSFFRSYLPPTRVVWSPLGDGGFSALSRSDGVLCQLPATRFYNNSQLQILTVSE